MQGWIGLPVERFNEVPEELRYRLFDCVLGVCTVCGFQLHSEPMETRVGRCPAGCRRLGCQHCSSFSGEAHRASCGYAYQGGVSFSRGEPVSSIRFGTPHYHLRTRTRDEIATRSP